MFLSVIVSTCNSPEWLTKVVWGYAAQSYRRFELLIADDGSNEDTARTVKSLRRATQLDIRHVWQPRTGFGKCRIVNRAIEFASADYLVFSDGDCIPRRDFLYQHLRHARWGRFLSGGAVRLPRGLSEQISLEDIITGRAMSARWLLANGLPAGRKLRMLMLGDSMAALFDTLCPTRATFNGGNSSAWKHDVLAVNGFDTRMGYGALDREFGDRLAHSGVRPLGIRHRAVCVHLDHDREYVDVLEMARNQQIWRQTRLERRTWTAHGIRTAPAVVPEHEDVVVAQPHTSGTWRAAA